MNLLQQKETESGKKTLYAIAYENWRTRKAGVLYLHASSQGDARAQILSGSHKWGSRTRIVGIAPAVGVHYEINSRGEAEVIYQ